MSRTNQDELKAKAKGCLLGGAVGDALGASVEFMSRSAILNQFGPKGITDFAPAYGGIGRITDDTQMTLFTAEGLIRGSVRGQLKGICGISGVVAHAYQRWLLTQGISNHRPPVSTDGWLFEVRALHQQRAPGTTCLSALREMRSFGDIADNNSKGCGGVMRVAPVAFATGWFNAESEAQWAFETAREICAITHGHPSGQLSGGFFAAYLTLLLSGETKASALSESMRILSEYRDHQEVTEKLELAVRLAQHSPDDHKALAKIGEGWVAEEAIAMSVYCALSTDDTEKAIILAVNHSGDSDSTGAITGNIMGLVHGVASIPERWLSDLELSAETERIAEDLIDVQGRAEEFWDRYPGY